MEEHACEGFIENSFVFCELVPNESVYKDANGVFEVFLLILKLLLICVSHSVGE
jgi:hypothetical protein